MFPSLNTRDYTKQLSFQNFYEKIIWYRNYKIIYLIIFKISPQINTFPHDLGKICQGMRVLPSCVLIQHENNGYHTFITASSKIFRWLLINSLIY
jgi:hypothetical protein